MSCPQHILHVFEAHQLEILAIKECRSAQQEVWIVQLAECPPNQGFPTSDETSIDTWKDCLYQGKNRVIVRQWKGGCRWWNLNQNVDVHSLAETEVWGYQQSSRLLHLSSESGRISIPRILYHQVGSSGERKVPPWVIVEYVGQESRYFGSDNLFDTQWVNGMIPTRHEFGFDEPHPRWGRLPITEALGYSKTLLQQFVIPLHNAYQRSVDQGRMTSFPPAMYTYDGVIETCRQVLGTLLQVISEQSVNDETIAKSMELVKSAIFDVLPANVLSIPHMSLVLVHLDLQPQNVLVSRCLDESLCIQSVLDWEDAAAADPRFELLLMGRKVCANREQAESLWEFYAQERFRGSATEHLGPLLPWLQLETVHSILTLLMQSMDALNGGRDPWESPKDLRGKLHRETARWQNWTTAVASSKPRKQRASKNKVTKKQPKNDYLSDLGIDPRECYFK